MVDLCSIPRRGRAFWSLRPDWFWAYQIFCLVGPGPPPPAPGSLWSVLGLTLTFTCVLR